MIGTSLPIKIELVGTASMGKKEIPAGLEWIFDPKERDKQTVQLYRDWAQDRQIQLTENTTDDLILEVYDLVIKHFTPRTVNGVREQWISDNTMGFIVLQMLIANERFGTDFMRDHLQYQIEYYRSNGLRPEYADGIPFPAR
jgi:hypothetical protein